MEARRLTLLLGLVLLIFSDIAAAGVFRCTDPKTKAVTYSSTPCAAGDERKVSITDNAIMDGSKFRREQTARQMDEADGIDENNAPPSGPTSNSGNTSGSAEQRDRLASECSRGLTRSCKTLRLLNGPGDGGAAVQVTAASAQRDRLGSECERGFKKSCDALRALNGEKERTKTVCNTAGVSTGYATRIGPNSAVSSGSYRGKTICRDRPDD